MVKGTKGFGGNLSEVRGLSSGLGKVYVTGNIRKTVLVGCE